LELVAPVTSVAKSPVASAKPKSAKTGGASDADFIANIEKALADAPPDPSPAARAAPAAAAPVALAPADEEPGGPAPTDAPAADALPTDIGPAIRTIPRGSLPADADAAPLVIAPQAAAPAVTRPGVAAPAPATFDQPAGAFDVAPEPGTPVPPEPIPNAQ
jgi:hypothetical protein